MGYMITGTLLGLRRDDQGIPRSWAGRRMATSWGFDSPMSTVRLPQGRAAIRKLEKVNARTKKWLRRVGIAAGAVALVAGLGIVNGTGAGATEARSMGATALGPVNSVGTNQLVNSGIWGVDIHDNTIPLVKMGWDFRQAIAAADVSKADSIKSSSQIKAGSIDYSDLNAALKAKVDSTTPGTPGTPGADAILSVTADSMVTDRPDTATDGSVWAKDSMTRTLTVVRQHAASASSCGAGAVKCWFYTGTIRDNGTFTTVAGAKSPRELKPISGTVNGSVNGVYEIEFFANSDLPNSSHVDTIVTGPAPSTSNWMKMAFPDDTKFAGFNGVDYKWIYNAPATCEVHVQTTAGNTGDIVGTNNC